MYYCIYRLDDFHKNISKPTHQFYNDNNPINEYIKTTQFFFQYGKYTKKQQTNNKYTKKWFREKYTDPKHADFTADTQDVDDDDAVIKNIHHDAAQGSFWLNDDNNTNNDNTNNDDEQDRKFEADYNHFKSKYDEIAMKYMGIKQLDQCIGECDYFISQIQIKQKKYVRMQLV